MPDQRRNRSSFRYGDESELGRICSRFLNSASLTQVTLKTNRPCSTMSAGLNSLKISASFYRSAHNKRTPRFLISSVHRVSVYFSHSAESHRQSLYSHVNSQSSVPKTPYPCVPNHSTAATASTGGHAASLSALKAATRSSEGKSGGNNSEGIFGTLGCVVFLRNGHMTRRLVPSVAAEEGVRLPLRARGRIGGFEE
jgi:hypothetical protein